MMKLNIKKMMIAVLSFAAVLSSCTKYQADLPGTGEIPDNTPPEAMFSYTVSDSDYLEIHFTNESISSTDYSWDLGNGTTAETKDAIAIYPGPGTYTVSLTSSDKLGKSSTYSEDITIVEQVVVFEPEILNPSFDIEGDDAYRDHWRNEDLGGPIQITSSPVYSSPKAAKFPSAGDRIGYQLITVEKNKNYIISYYYTMKESGIGDLTVSVLAGHVTDPAAVDAATIAKTVGTDQSSADTYVLEQVSFNSGDNSEVAIYVTNSGVECRLDSFTIVED